MQGTVFHKKTSMQLLHSVSGDFTSGRDRALVLRQTARICIYVRMEDCRAIHLALLAPTILQLRTLQVPQSSR